MSDESIAKRIEKLVAEEHHLYQQPELGDRERNRIRELEVELDVCWDLLRQRRAKREFGKDENEAKARSPEIVESYIG